MSDVIQYKCPNCGGRVEFSGDAQKLVCPFCDTEFEIDELSDAGNSAPQQPSADGFSGTETPWREDETTGMRIYVCQSCGGEIIGDENMASSSCPFCDNPIIVKSQFSNEMRPDLLIPFKVDKKAAKEKLKAHIARHNFVPGIFKNENHLDEIKGVYVPYWLFSCDAEGDVVYDAQAVRTWSDGNYNYTETSFFELDRSGRISVSSLPVDGSTKMDDTLMESIEPFDLNEAVEFNMAYLSGYLTDKYDVGSEESSVRANERIRQSVADALKTTVPAMYSAVNEKNVRVGISNGICRYALYPVWILNTSWNGQKFVFAVNGQTGKIVGDLPLDKSQFWKWVGILTPVIGGVLYGLKWLLQLL